MPSLRAKPARIIGRIHLIYLGLLPFLATFAVLRIYGYSMPFLLFSGSTLYIALLVLAWVGSMIAGQVLHEMSPLA